MKKRRKPLTINRETILLLSNVRGDCWETIVAPCDPENPTPSGNPDHYCG